MFESFDARWIFGAFFLAVAIFAFYTYYHKTVLGRLVRAILNSGAESPETAKTFAELDLVPTPAYERALLGSGSLSHIVSFVGTVPKKARILGQSNQQATETLSVLALYVSPERRRKAQSIYSAEQSIAAPIAVTAAALVLTVVLVLLFPQISALFS
ncbi:MAG: hypothetical protein J6J21_01065 [Clostridia bacterium]|nr:hypothetical protein [Clostridia bacterium]